MIDLLKEVPEKQRSLIQSFFFSFIFFFCSHLYRFTHLGYTDDCVEILQRTNRNWQLSLGRWLQVFYWKVRGQIVVPYVIGLLAFLFFALSIYLIVRMLNLHSNLSVALLCIVLGCNGTLTFSNATYISWTDVYMLAFLMSCLSVTFTRKWSLGFVPGSICLCMTLALYQAYLQTAILLFMILFVKDCLTEHSTLFTFLKKVLHAILTLICGLLLYAVSLIVVEKHTGIERSMGYNGVGRVGHYTLSEIPRLLFETWKAPFRTLLKPETNLPGLTTICAIGMIVLSIFLVCLLIRKNHVYGYRIFVIALLLLTMPFGMNVVFFLSHGMEHSLMIFSFFLFFAFPIMLMEICDAKTIWARRSRIIAGPLVAVMLLNNFVYANQVYARRDLEFWSTLSLMTRVIDRAEQVEGYQSGYTNVAIIGTLYNSPLAMQRPGFEQLEGNSPYMNNNYYATSGETFYPAYFWEILGYPFNLVPENERYRIAHTAEVVNMPTFPEPGCCQMIDDVLVIKIGRVAGE